MTESARWATRQAVIETILGDEDLDSLASSVVGMKEAEDAIVHRIGMLMVDSKDSEANNLRDCLYRAQTIREVGERVLAEGRRIREEAP